MVHVTKRDSDNPARIYTSPTAHFFSSTTTGWLWSNALRTAYGVRPTVTHSEQPVDARPCQHAGCSNVCAAGTHDASTAAHTAAGADIPAPTADLRSADENNDSSPAHPSSDAAKDMQSIASPEHHVAPPATLQNNHVGSQENTEAAHPNMDSRPRSLSPPPVVLRGCSAVHGRPPSLPRERQNRWHYTESQTHPAAPDRRQQPAPSFHLPDQVRKIASSIQPTTSPPAHPGLDRAPAARPTARPTARLQHAQNPQLGRDSAGSGQNFFGPSIRPPRTSDTSRGSNTAASSHERQPQLQAPRSDKELATLQQDFLPF